MAVPIVVYPRRTVPSGKVIVDRLRAYRSQSSIQQSENERPTLAAVLPFAMKTKTKRRKSHWKAAAIQEPIARTARPSEFLAHLFRVGSRQF